MYIKKEMVVEAILYKGDKIKVKDKFKDIPDEVLDKIPNGNFILKENETFINKTPQDFNNEYIEFKQTVINNVTYDQLPNEDKEAIEN